MAYCNECPHDGLCCANGRCLKRVFGAKLMTRQQAIDKIIATTQYSIGAATLFVDNLEALGLIKFDPPKREREFEEIINADQYRELEENGYQIVKLGKNTTVRLESSCLVDRGKYNGKLLSIDQRNNLDTK